MTIETELTAGNVELFATFGVQAILSRATAQTYDPMTGGMTGGDPVESEIVVILGEREQTIANGAVNVIDTAEALVELKQGDVLAVGSFKFTVVAVNPDAPFGNILSWIADIEGYAE